MIPSTPMRERLTESPTEGETGFVAYPRTSRRGPMPLAAGQYRGLYRAYRSLAITASWWIAAVAVFASSAYLLSEVGALTVAVAMHLIFGVLVARTCWIISPTMNWRRGVSVPLAAIAGSAPWINILIVAVIMLRVIRRLKDAGIKVGFLGPRRRDVEDAAAAADGRVHGAIRFDKYPSS